MIPVAKGIGTLTGRLEVQAPPHRRCQHLAQVAGPMPLGSSD